jgi:hypothetical protein
MENQKFESNGLQIKEQIIQYHSIRFNSGGENPFMFYVDKDGLHVGNDVTRDSGKLHAVLMEFFDEARRNKQKEVMEAHNEFFNQNTRPKPLPPSSNGRD